MRNVSVKIFESVIDLLSVNALNQSPDETGGVLVGTRSCTDDLLEYNILGAVGISSFNEFKDIYNATATEFTCTDRMGWAKLALKAVEIYGMSYIGDWHSHPKSNFNNLSPKDISHILQQYELRQFNPFPPLHVLLSWPLGSERVSITANIMLHNNVIAVIKPQIIE
ncbi:Mov34/MPN/PAD-1 family protein [Pelosinus propionicus]|uniref:JAB domain-containing protein n=1 Tax=Pelosinus propionicus DSM 13327 TaxID=1123291 RepID=A0A1I4PG66_9FIRM|nr:Mov34/MPN/PAD-1 family protein [Pelosinus propionicus]SFM26761.1 JAB domain-containing protein [Pelosinus propionicus DSM 13327]